MEPHEAARALAPIASECMRILVMVSAPRLHPKLRTVLPPGTTADSLFELFGRFAEAARVFDEHAGLIGGAERFVRAAGVLARMPGVATGWQPMLADPPEKVMEVSRLALKHLGVGEPEGGWEAYGDEVPPQVQ